MDSDSSAPAFRERASFTLPLTVEAVPEARHRIAKAVRGRLRREAIARTQLLVSEIATNAIRHGEGELEVIVTLFEDRVRIEMVDRGPGFMPLPRDRPPYDAGGWGLYLVQELASDWGVTTGARTRVWFEVAAQAAPAAGTT